MRPQRGPHRRVVWCRHLLIVHDVLSLGFWLLGAIFCNCCRVSIPAGGKLCPSILILSITQEAKMNTEHFHAIGTGFLLCDQSAVNGIGNREVEVPVLILREEPLCWTLMKTVNVIRELVSIDLTSAPSPELSLELRELTGELTFIGHGAELAEPTTLRLGELTVGVHYSTLMHANAGGEQLGKNRQPFSPPARLLPSS
jgi:hypothetical protein